VIRFGCEHLANGQGVNFWLDKWLAIPVVDWLGLTVIHLIK